MAVMIGLDVGDARIGVAASDPSRFLATPVEVIHRKDGTPAAKTAAVARLRGADAVVLGLPRNMDGSEGPQARNVRSFAGQLAAAFAADGLGPVELLFWDERMSTRQARRMLIESGAGKKRRAEPVDALAAAVILQAYLDHLRARPAGAAPAPTEGRP